MGFDASSSLGYYVDNDRPNLPNVRSAWTSLGSKVEKDPSDFIDEAYWIIILMGVPSKEKDELVAYQLRE